MDEEVLITLVGQYRELYDLQNPHYDDFQRRTKIWEEIGGVIEHSAEDCRERWKRVRDNYRRAKKLRKIKRLKGAKNIKDPKYTNILTFLDPFIESDSESGSNPNLDDEDVTQIKEEDERVTQAGSSSASKRIKKKKKLNKIIKKRKTEATDPSVTRSLVQDYLDKKNILQNVTDPVVSFFQNLGQTVRSFPEYIQIRVKSDVFRIVNEAEEEVYMMKTNTLPAKV